MNPSDFREQLADWIGSRVAIVTTEGHTHHGRLKALGTALELETAVIEYPHVAEVWVPLIGGD